MSSWPGRSSAVGGLSSTLSGITVACRISPPAKPVNEGLGHVLDDGKPARRIPVKRRIADRELAFIARRKDQPAELVGQPHENDPPQPALDVLFGQTGSAARRTYPANISSIAAWAGSIDIVR